MFSAKWKSSQNFNADTKSPRELSRGLFSSIREKESLSRLLLDADVKIPDHEDDQGNLQDENGRHAVLKVPVFCLVAEDLHAQDGAKASKDEGNKKQGSFGDPPGVLLCPALVDAHHDETG